MTALLADPQLAHAAFFLHPVLRCGEVDADGVFQAGPDEGSFVVYGDGRQRPGHGERDRGQARCYAAPVVKPPEKQETTGLSWVGQGPAQK